MSQTIRLIEKLSVSLNKEQRINIHVGRSAIKIGDPEGSHVSIALGFNNIDEHGQHTLDVGCSGTNEDNQIRIYRKDGDEETMHQMSVVDGDYIGTLIRALKILKGDE